MPSCTGALLSELFHDFTAEFESSMNSHLLYTRGHEFASSSSGRNYPGAPSTTPLVPNIANPPLVPLTGRPKRPRTSFVASSQSSANHESIPRGFSIKRTAFQGDEGATEDEEGPTDIFVAPVFRGRQGKTDCTCDSSGVTAANAEEEKPPEPKTPQEAERLQTRKLQANAFVNAGLKVRNGIYSFNRSIKVRPTVFLNVWDSCSSSLLR